MSELFTISSKTLKQARRLARYNRFGGNEKLALVALISLILNLSGVLTIWHIPIEGGTKCHDCTNCKICSTTFLNIAKTTSPQTAEPVIFNTFSETILVSWNRPENQADCCPTNPRAPPIPV